MLNRKEWNFDHSLIRNIKIITTETDIKMTTTIITISRNGKDSEVVEMD